MTDSDYTQTVEFKARDISFIKVLRSITAPNLPSVSGFLVRSMIVLLTHSMLCDAEAIQQDSQSEFGPHSQTAAADRAKPMPGSE